MTIQISIIIPLFNAVAVLPRALASIAQQDIFSPDIVQAPSTQKILPKLHPNQIEVILAADDHHDYGFARSLLPLEMRLRLIQPIGIGTGPGATRNRGIAQSKGRFLTFLDADDTWSPSYLSQLWPQAKRHGASFAVTSVLTSQGDELIVLGQGSLKSQPKHHSKNLGATIITPRYFGDWPGSFHPMVRRDLSPGFDHGAGQDVFHALEVLGAVGGLFGGGAPLVQSAAYQLHLSAGSVTANPAFTRRIDRRYRDWQYRYQHHQTALTGMARLEALQALYRRRFWNHAFAQKGSHEDGFYGFLSKYKK